MGEKKGFTGKLEYDFPTEKSTEVLIEDIGWLRVTCREFRSHNSPRRIIYWQKGQQVIEDYKGPVYLFMTNKIIDNPTEPGIQYVDNIRPESKPRKYEDF
jgi:hypothetical protein